jgi:hypothetical protein
MKFQKISFCSLFCCIAILIFLKTTIINAQNSTKYKYFIGNSEPDTAWKNKEFNDTLWQNGIGSIGFGDNDDSVIIENTISVYLRYHLNEIRDFPPLDIIEAIVLDIDYDDGFIAYLNGHELMRINMNEEIIDPDHDQLASRSHEAVYYRYSRPDTLKYNGYYFDSTIYRMCELDSNSVLAFQVHNDSINGSDLTFSMELKFLTDTITDYLEAFHQFDFNYSSPVKIDSSELPIIVIETDEYGYPQNKDNTYAYMGIIDNGPGKYNKPEDPFSGYSGAIRTHLRGSFSMIPPKHTYAVETQDSYGNNNNVSIMGMPKENDWILYGPYFDKSLIRNELAFSIGRRLGYYEPRTRFCELLLNGQNLGLYIMTERIKRDKNRVDITSLKPENDAWPEISGGYIFKIDHTEDIEIVYPDEDKITPAQTEYIHSYYDSAFYVLHRSYFRDPQVGYRKYFDVPSLIDFFLISELSRNFDAYYGSMFMYKDNSLENRKITYGPLWDYDYAFITHYYRDMFPAWRYEGWDPLNRCFEDSAFTNEAINRWFLLRQGLFHTDSLAALIDSIILPLRPYIERNYKVWPSVNKPYSSIVTAGCSYEEEISIIKSWIAERAAWIDENILDVQQEYSGPFIEVAENQLDQLFICYPNPFSDILNFEFQSITPGVMRIELVDLTGSCVYRSSDQQIAAGTNTIKLQGLRMLPDGYYLLKAYLNGLQYTEKGIVKIH